MMFMISDRVEAVETYGSVRKGDTGVVVRLIGINGVGVYWDQHRPGMHGCGGKCPFGYGFNVPLHFIKMIESDDGAYEPLKLESLLL